MFEWLDEKIKNLKQQGKNPTRAMLLKQKLIDQLNNIPQELKIEIDYLFVRYKQLKESLSRATEDSPISWSPPITQDFNPLDKYARVRIKTKGGFLFISYDELSDVVELWTSSDEYILIMPGSNNSISIKVKTEDE